MIFNGLEQMTKHLQLSEEDRKMLKLLVDSGGKISSFEISQQFGVSLSTVQRRRKKLEDTYFIRTYSLDPVKLGYRRIELLIYTVGGTTIDIGMELLKREEVTSVFRTLGEHAIDLRVEVFVKDNAALLDLLDQVRAMKGVKDVIWTEIFEPMDMTSATNRVSRGNEVEPRPANLAKSELKTYERYASIALPEIPAHSNFALDLPERSTEELKILERINVIGQ